MGHASYDLSQNPVDVLIRDIIAGRREPPADAAEQVILRMRSAPFEPASLRRHHAKRIATGQWAAGTTEEEYVRDLQVAIAYATSIGVYDRRGGNVAAAFCPSRTAVPSQRRGSDMQPNLIVIHSADWGTLISGYGFSTMEKLVLGEVVTWLR